MKNSDATPTMRQAQRVVVLNQAAAILSFHVEYKDELGKDGTSNTSGNLLYNQKHSIDMIKFAGIYTGAKIRPMITVTADGDYSGVEIEYAPNELSAVYSVSGTLGSIKIEIV